MHKSLVVASVALLIVGSMARAQDAQRLAPKLPPANAPATVESAPPAVAGMSGEQTVVQNLQGVVFVQKQTDLQASSSARGVQTALAPLVNSPRFVAQISPYLNHPLTLSKLNEICRLAVVCCRSVDRPVVDAIVPQQDVTTGAVQILILQGHIGDIRAEGNRHFPSKLFTSAVRAKTGDEISQSRLLDDLDWLNENPFHKTDLVLQPGAELGQTEVVLQTQDQFPLRLYAGYENTGTRSTGGDRYLAGLNTGNTLGFDDQLNYQFTTGDNFSQFSAHSGSYTLPLPWHHNLTLFGNWSNSKVQTDSNIAQNGEAWQLSGRYEIPLPRRGDVTSSLVFGGDFKRTNTNADFGGNSVFASEVDVVQFMAGYNLTLTSLHGVTNASLEGYYSPGHIGGQDDRAAYESARTGADSQYEYARLTLDHTCDLPLNMAWVSRFQGQLASGVLLGSEQLGVGGIDSVRGYYEREGNGDSGVIFSNEIHSPSASFFSVAGRKDQLYLLTFLDYGVAWMRDAQGGQPGQENFLGAGPGISYHLGPWLSVDYGYGWRIAEGDPSVHATGRNHLRVMLSFTY
jgi:hemolysin activation/secretion protein